VREPRVRVEDMLNAIEKIQRYAVRGKDAIQNDELLQVYIVHHLIIIGEAAFKMPPEVRAKYPDIHWKQIVGMRHILVHDYFEVDVDIVWQVVEHDLPALESQLLQILEDWR